MFTNIGQQRSTLANNPNHRCTMCGNRDPNLFLTDEISGTSVCLGIDSKGCGNVVQDHATGKGADKRNFQDETEDRQQHGPPPNKYMPDADNMKTYLNYRSNAPGSRREQKTWKNLIQTQQIVEFNLR